MAVAPGVVVATGVAVVLVVAVTPGVAVAPGVAVVFEATPELLCDLYSKKPTSPAATRMTTITTAMMPMMPLFLRRGCGGGEFGPSPAYVDEGMVPVGYVGDDGVLPLLIG